MIALDGLLMIEPSDAPSAPIVDDLTRSAAGVWGSRTTSEVGYRGMHQCTGNGCTAMSDNQNHYIQVGSSKLLTNSLLVHYVACHRDEVPPDQLATITALGLTAEPTTEQLTGRMAPRSSRPPVYR